MSLPPMDTAEQASAFFDELERASAVARYRLTGSYDEAQWGRAAYSAAPIPQLPKSVNGLPSTVIIHYTASPTLQSTVAWFCKASLNSQRAAHIAVAQDLDKVFKPEELRVYPTIAQLPALPVICRSPKKPAVHATWANGISVGIELVNLGTDVVSAFGKTRDLAQASGRTWEKYPSPQIETAAFLVRALRLMCPAIGLDAVLGHEHVQGAQTPNVLEDKRDPGPMFPWPAFRDACRIARDAKESDDRPTYIADLEELGYYMRGPTHPSIKIFQYMMGLSVDGVAGPKTQAAIQKRLVDRGLRGIA